MTESLTIDRSGSFRLQTLGDFHCGTGLLIEVHYHLSVCCRPRLDDRGFLFDQVGVHRYFSSIRSSDRSCEKLVLDCMEAIIGRIKRENPKIRLISAELSLSPYPHLAKVTCRKRWS